MKPVNQLITKVEEEESDEESHWPKLRKLSRDEDRYNNYNEQQEYQQEDENYKVR